MLFQFGSLTLEKDTASSVNKGLVKIKTYFDVIATFFTGNVYVERVFQGAADVAVRREAGVVVSERPDCLLPEAELLVGPVEADEADDLSLAWLHHLLHPVER